MADAFRKPQILSLGQPTWADNAVLDKFQSQFDLHIIQPTDRASTIELISEAAVASGPFYGVLILMGNSAYDPFDEELLGPLVPGLQIVACVNAGYSEFDLQWFTKNKIFVTNTLHAVAEPTADIAIFLILAALRDTSANERLIRQGSWRSAKTPPRDPNGLTLGIIGMGRIGKVLLRP